ncbi:MAG: carboxyl transferase [Clostridia bacterium]|nr:carboxyl transferase [Clostridia bacterium]
MSIDNNKKMSAKELLSALFDDGAYTELGGKLYSEDNFAEAVAACGKVSGQPVYAFAQAEDRCGGAMSVAQANKLKKLYAMALKTGYPIVGFYMNSSARVLQGNMLLDELGDLLASSGRLSGVVPQISVVLGNCISATALLASNADFVIMTENAKLSVSDTSDCTGKKKAAVVTADAKSAVEAVCDLITYLPSNNLSVAPACEDIAADTATPFDSDSVLKLYEGMGEGAEVSFARLSGQVVGSVKTLGKALDCKTCKKIASFVRFCDAFSIPVVTEVNVPDFECLGGAKVLLSAYAEATTAKISVITGTAHGVVYLALAGKGSRADAILALEGATVSPIKPEAAAYVALADKLNVPAAEQDKLIAEYIATELSADNAAKAGYIDDVVDTTALRDKLIGYMDILSGKRESSLPKKHNTI